MKWIESEKGMLLKVLLNLRLMANVEWGTAWYDTNRGLVYMVERDGVVAVRATR